MLSFVYEGYTFLVCCNSALWTCLHNDGSPYEILALRPLKQSSSFGSIYAGTHDLFELVPQVQSLHHWRLAQESTGWASPSPEFQAAYHNLNHAIESWGTGPAGPDNNDLHMLEPSQRWMATEVIRDGLRIYLSTSLYGSAAPPFEAQQDIEGIAKNAVDASILLQESPYASHTVWALVIAGSCLVDHQYRRRLAEFLAQSRYKMRHLSAACKVLELLWADNTEAFGPYGLQLVMQKQGMSLSIM